MQGKSMYFIKFAIVELYDVALGREQGCNDNVSGLYGG